MLVFPIGVMLLAFGGAASAHDDGLPQVSGEAASQVSQTASASLAGSVNPNGEPTTYFFEYGPTTAYGTHTSQGSAGKSKSPQPVAATLGGLDASTTYHYRLVATSKKGTTRGSDHTFTTLDSSSPPRGRAATPAAAPHGAGDGRRHGDSYPRRRRSQSRSRIERLVAPGRGELLVRRPGSSRFVALGASGELPVGSEVDARAGVLTLTSALPSGKPRPALRRRSAS